MIPLHTPRAGRCSCGHRACSSPGKHPRTKRGLTDASTDPHLIAAWWRRWPDANLGVRTGELVVIDVDGAAGRAVAPRTSSARHAARHPLRDQRARVAPLLPRRRASRRFFDRPRRPGIDVRGHGGYVVAPPSRHANGTLYRWKTMPAVTRLPQLARRAPIDARRTGRARPLPATVVGESNERARRYLQAAADAELLEVAGAPVGTRNATLNRAAFRLGQLVGAGLGHRPQLANALLGAALSAGLGEREARATIDSGLLAGERNPRSLPRFSASLGEVTQA